MASILQEIIRLLSPYSEIIYPLIFFGFFAVVLVGIAFRHRPLFRQGTLVMCFGLLVVTNATGVGLLPGTELHLYGSAAPTEDSQYEVRVVDSQGRELLYDPEAVSPMGLRLREIGGQMATRYSEATTRDVAAFLLHEAREHRQYRASGRPVIDRFAFPPHRHLPRWTEDRLEPYSRFVGIRVYRIDRTYAENGTRVRSETETRVVDVRPRPSELDSRSGGR